MLGIALYPLGLSYADIATMAKRVEDGGYAGIYFTERMGNNDALAAAQVAAAATHTLTVGTSTVNGYLRLPIHLAAQAMAVDEISGGRFVLGIGASSRRVEVHGLAWRPAVGLLSEITDILRAAFAGRTLDGSPLGRRALHPIPIHWGAMAIASIQAAGAKADGLMKFLAPLPRLTEAIKLFHRSVREAGMDPAARRVSLLMPTFLSDDLEAAYDAARRYLAWYAATPINQKVFAAGGFESEVAAIRREDPTDLAAVARHFTEPMLDSIVVIGSAARCRERLAAFTDAGVDDLLLAPVAVQASAQSAVEALITGFSPA